MLLSSHLSELCNAVDQLLVVIDKGNVVVTLYLDLSKAFDLVNHDLRLKTLAVFHFSQHSSHI